jgi:hypothetical protein
VVLCRLTLPLDRLCGFVGACILHIVVTLHFSETVRVLEASVSVQQLLMIRAAAAFQVMETRIEHIVKVSAM